MATTNPIVNHSYGTGAANYGQHTLLSSIDALPPDVSTKLYRRFGGQGLEILNLLIAQGAKRVITNSNGGFHFEENRYHSKLAAANISAWAGGSPTEVFTYNASQEIDSTSTQYYAYPAIGDLVINLDNEQKGRVTAKVDAGSGNFTYTVATLDGANWGTTTPTLVIYSSSFDEDTAQPEAKASYWEKFSFQLQRHKTTAKITGDALTDKLYPVMMDDGKSLKGFHTHLFAQHEYRHLLGLVGSMIYGDVTTASGQPSTTKGMVETFKDRAVQEAWTSATLVDDFYNLVNGLKANWVGTDLIGLLSKDLYVAAEQELLSYTNNVNIASTRQESAKTIFGNNTDFETMMSTFAFSTITLNGKNLNLKSFDLSYDPVMFGATSTAKFKDYGFFIPAEKSADAQGVLRNCVELTYKSMDGEDRFMKVWDDGAASPRRLGPNDNYVVYMLTQFGFDWFKIEQCGLLYK